MGLERAGVPLSRTSLLALLQILSELLYLTWRRNTAIILDSLQSFSLSYRFVVLNEVCLVQYDHQVVFLEQLGLFSGEEVVADDQHLCERKWFKNEGSCKDHAITEGGHLAVAEVILSRCYDGDVFGIEPRDPLEGGVLPCISVMY